MQQEPVITQPESQDAQRWRKATIAARTENGCFLSAMMFIFGGMLVLGLGFFFFGFLRGVGLAMAGSVILGLVGYFLGYWWIPISETDIIKKYR